MCLTCALGRFRHDEKKKKTRREDINFTVDSKSTYGQSGNVLFIVFIMARIYQHTFCRMWQYCVVCLWSTEIIVTMVLPNVVPVELHSICSLQLYRSNNIEQGPGYTGGVPGC